MNLANKWKRYFLEQPRPAAVFQIAPSYFACLKVGLEKKLSENDYFIQRIPAGVIEANFLQSNIRQPEILEQFIDRALQKLKLPGNSVTVILPETSSRVFVFSLEGTFLTPTELVKFIEWRLKRQLAQPLSDIRYSYQTFNSGREKKVLVVCSGLEVIKEYETIFQKKKLQPGKLTIPSLSIFNLLPGIKEDDFLVVDADFDYLSLMAVIEGSLYLYRQKQLLPSLENSLEVILKEVENTLYFIEDKTRRKVRLLCLRSNFEATESLKRVLQTTAAVEIVEIEPENRAIAPMLGGL
ncbi:MAG: hypothetical protein H5U06_06540 [Candidatus Aminicenantes bacterium]|nr:hypothetical protein [Candidatus Aminicenantes bacterium]